ncbi:MAG: hypothetical protein WBC76_07160 [Actinomycetes bacterium]|jgi:hypothetical protein|nr:hypothetical protein [Actinomycetes bacterium]
MVDAQRALAVQYYNQSWDLIDKSGRSPADDRRLLMLAVASRALWDDIGGDEQWITGDWQVAHVAALTGHASLSLEFAAAAYERATTADVPLWLKASTCEGLARAHAAAGHTAERDAWVVKARELLERVDDPDDRAVIEGQLATVGD